MPDRPQVPEDWKFVSVSPAMVTLDFDHWYKVPEGMPLSEFLTMINPRPIPPED